jgi:hypothetical protein
MGNPAGDKKKLKEKRRKKTEKRLFEKATKTEAAAKAKK